MIIRKYDSNDIEGLIVLFEDLGYPTTSEQLKIRLDHIHQNSDNFTFVCEEENSVIGMIGIRLFHYYEGDGLAAQISILVVRKDKQRTGIGGNLIQYVENWLSEKKVRLLTVNSGMREERKGAHQFYMKLGYVNNGLKFSKTLLP